MSEIPTKPYLLRALFEWCVDNGYTPHLAVKVDSRTQVPLEYVKNGEITLNISPNAVHKLQMGNELIEFSARFAGVARQISVPVPCIYALYAREMLGVAMEALHLSARGYHRVLRVARTIADLDDSTSVAAPHVAEALRFRPRTANTERAGALAGTP